MQSGETPPSNNSEINPTAGNENPWSKMAEEAPPFNSGETQSADTPETIDKKPNLTITLLSRG